MLFQPALPVVAVVDERRYTEPAVRSAAQLPVRVGPGAQGDGAHQSVDQGGHEELGYRLPPAPNCKSQSERGGHDSC